ncbi:phage holin family protein, partial [Burkholderia multivorans]|nr:phage holin family protein [Burkholderia multivorans]
MLTAVYVLLCAALALRLVIFRRGTSAHRP